MLFLCFALANESAVSSIDVQTVAGHASVVHQVKEFQKGFQDGFLWKLCKF
jgi:hypothetical protein